MNVNERQQYLYEITIEYKDTGSPFLVSDFCKKSFGFHPPSDENENPISESPFYFRMELKFEDKCPPSDWEFAKYIGPVIWKDIFYRGDCAGPNRPQQYRLDNFSLLPDQPAVKKRKLVIDPVPVAATSASATETSALRNVEPRSSFHWSSVDRWTSRSCRFDEWVDSEGEKF